MQTPYESDPNRPQYTPQQPYYPPQQYQQPPMQQGPGVPPQKPRKPRRWPWIVACFVCLAIGYGAGSGDHAAPATTADTTTQAAAPTSLVTHTTPVVAKPTATSKPLVWTTTQTFTGDGGKKTASFTIAGNDWKISWSCQETNGIDSPLFITVDDATNNMVDSAQTTCKASTTTTGETEEHQGGTFYLDVNSGIQWSIKVQELK